MLAVVSSVTVVRRVALVGATSTKQAADSRAAVCMQAVSKTASLSSAKRLDLDLGVVTIAVHAEND